MCVLSSIERIKVNELYIYVIHWLTVENFYQKNKSTMCAQKKRVTLQSRTETSVLYSSGASLWSEIKITLLVFKFVKNGISRITFRFQEVSGWHVARTVYGVVTRKYNVFITVTWQKQQEGQCHNTAGLRRQTLTRHCWWWELGVKQQ